MSHATGLQVSTISLGYHRTLPIAATMFPVSGSTERGFEVFSAEQIEIRNSWRLLWMPLCEAVIYVAAQIASDEIEALGAIRQALGKGWITGRWQASLSVRRLAFLRTPYQPMSYSGRSHWFLWSGTGS